MYHEIKTEYLHSFVDSIWYADSSDVDVPYVASPELGANLVIKLYPHHSEVVLSGAVTKQQVYPYIPQTHYFGVRFQPGYQVPEQLASLHELHNTSIDIPDRILQHWNCFDERLREQPTLQKQLTALYRHTSQMLSPTTSLPSLVQEALYHIHRQHGAIKIYDLAHHLMVSERHLERLFKKHLGLSPKLVCNTVRIRQILDILWQPSQKPTLSDLALQFGYTDQAHLANDFRNIMGISISEYRRR